ncbi:MAG: hypothetical protein NTX88_10140 [Candidatus Atribacteria bacterium]|nr:hypothetical protein [Candidatus Atribacteria bacterium]
MRMNIQINPVEMFVSYARMDGERWKKIIGCSTIHHLLGTGTVIRIERGEKERVFYYENNLAQDYWNRDRACKFWRKAHHPGRAIELTDFIPNHRDQRFMAALLTARGGAFRDSNIFDEALRCGEEALKHDPKSFPAYDLLGAIYYQSGFPEKGDAYFEQATQLGSIVG